MDFSGVISEKMKQYPDLKNLQGRSHSIKYGEINHVKYRFQAISFSSDVLDTLVWNSPPIRRKKKENREKNSSSEDINKLPDISKRYFRRSMSLNCIKRFEDEFSDCTSDYQSDEESSDASNKLPTTNSELSESSKQYPLYSPSDLEDKSKEELISIISQLQTTKEEKDAEKKHRTHGHPKIKALIKKFER